MQIIISCPNDFWAILTVFCHTILQFINIKLLTPGWYTCTLYNKKYGAYLKPTILLLFWNISIINYAKLMIYVHARLMFKICYFLRHFRKKYVSVIVKSFYNVALTETFWRRLTKLGVTKFFSQEQYESGIVIFVCLRKGHATEHRSVMKL